MIETSDKFDKDMIVNVINSQREKIMKMIKVAKKLATQQMQWLINQGAEEMLTRLDSEIERLRRLQKINQGIKEQEITQMEEIRELSQINLHQTQLRLDAARFIITS
jgi:ATP-dependent helicase HepA